MAPAALVASLAASVAVTFAPWLRTGGARRNSYEVVQAADHLDVLGTTPELVLSVVWAFLPLLAVLALLAWILGRRRLALGLAAGVAVAEIAMAAVVVKAPQGADWGARAGLGTGVAASIVIAAIIGNTWRTT